MERYISLLKEFILQNCRQMIREPSHILKYPYTVPSSPDSPYYSMTLWDWDSWFISVVMGQVELDTGEKGKFFEYEAGCVRNFLDHTGEDGVVPILISDQGIMRRNLPGKDPLSENMHKPMLVQQAALLVQRSGDASWIKPLMEKLGCFLNRYLTSHVHQETGLAYWQSDFAVGVDNDPSVFYRPDKSCGSIYLNSLLYRELLAYGFLWEMLGNVKEANVWRGKASKLAQAIQAHCWDERDGTFYSADLNLRPVDPNDWLHQGAPRTWNSLLMRVDCWSSFLPLWAGFASQTQADRMLERYRDTRTFNSRFGVRTLSQLEKMYSLGASNNPSNWLGPIWGVSNYMVFRGLLKYGFYEDARELAEKTVRLFGQDLEKAGSLHEFYHPDNGEPIMTHGFQNWNFLVLNMIAYLEDRPMAVEF